jgi:preprotein translocase subunit SecA
MRRFNSGLVERFLSAAGLPDDSPIESKMVSNAIRSAQTQVEAQNFEIRKNVLKYDDVMNRQREVIYGERRLVLEGEDISPQVQTFVADTLVAYVNAETTNGFGEDWDLERLWQALKLVYPISFTPEDMITKIGSRAALDSEYLTAQILEDATTAYEKRQADLGAEVMRELERKVLLSVLDRKWREHLYEMDYLQEGIGLRAMAQRDPLVEYQREGYELFAAMMDGIKEELASLVFNVQVTVEGDGSQVKAAGITEKAADVTALQYTASDESGVATKGEVSRNSQCPCGSGKKYKRCHGGV